jgi:superfamily II DNA or RNA helicase
MELRTAQKLFLDKVMESRKKGNNKGILIFATGLGKTLASLSDALRIAGKRGKVLVLAHNHNLLYQHAKDFKLLNRTKKIGFLYKSKKDVNAEVLFANIMTLKQTKYLYSFKPDEFDYIIVDETHHAGAKSYKCIFDYFKPKFLLGMTATPNRTDQVDILPMYDNNTIMNMDSFEAINKGWLRPYKYVFLWDKWCNYEKIKSYRIKGGYHKYDINELGKAYYIPERDKAIVKEFKERAINRRGIGFCVSVNEAIRMANLFNKNGINAIAIWGASKKGRTMNEKKRNKILEDYENGKHQIIFNCDIIGEGLHLPSVDVILKLRPTQSSIKDNQHNGRGLYNIEGLKINENQYAKLLIIDWVGNYNNAYENYIYQGRLKEIKDREIKDIREIIEMPIGCEVEFKERVITEFNKQIAKNSFGINDKVSFIKSYNQLKEELGRNPTYHDILNNGLSPHLIYIFWGNIHKFREDMGETQYWKKRKKYEIDRLRKEYERLKSLLKKIPTEREMAKYGKIRPCDFYCSLGVNGWRNVKRYYGDMGDWTKKENIIKKFEEYLKDENNPISLSSFFKFFKLSNHHFINHYKDSEDFFSKNSDLIKKYRGEFYRIGSKYNKKYILNKYKKVKNKVKNIPTLKEIKTYGKISERPFERHYGSYPDFLEKVGDYEEYQKRINKIRRFPTNNIPWNKNKKGVMPQSWCKGKKLIQWDKNDLRKNYFRLKEELGKQPSCRDIDKDGKFNHTQYTKVYGSYPDFLRNIGEPILNNKESSKLDRQDIIKNYLEMKNKLGREPTNRDLQTSKGSRYSSHLYRKIWGGLTKFREFLNNLNNNIKITSNYRPKTIIIPIKKHKKGLKKSYEGLHKEEYKSKVDKVNIRKRIISKIQDGDNVLLLESPDLSAIKEIEKQNKKPNKIIIPNHLEFKKLANVIQNYKTDLNIEIVNTSVLQYLVDSEERFDFIWLDYCGAFSYYMKDLDILFSKKFNNIKLVLTYNLFDPAKEDENYYFTRVIDYVLSKNETNKIRLINDISYRYKKNMYNLGFNIENQEVHNR